MPGRDGNDAVVLVAREPMEDCIFNERLQGQLNDRVLLYLRADFRYKSNMLVPYKALDIT
jgi:hypothetical protein